MKIFCDFDGVICARKGIPTMDYWSDCKPKKGALDSIRLLLNLGHEVCIFTANPEPERVKEWLSFYEFPDLRVTNIKEHANVYIDDRAIRFTNWNDIRKYFS